MTSVSEALTSGKSELAGDLAAGVGAISSNQTITFTKYIRLVLPLDGYVFWVKADLVSGGALANASAANAFAANQPPVVTTEAPVITVAGSLHYASDEKQGAEASYTINRVVFTATKPVNDFDQVGPNIIFIGEFNGVKFAFSSRKSFYQQAGLSHYVGDAVYPVMESQLVDSIQGFNATLIVSNSLPIWLSMNGYIPQPWEPFGNQSMALYPAYLAEENASPPFAAVDITSTVPIAASPYLGKTLTHSQQVRDRVRVTLWGLDNDAAMNFVDFVEQYSLNTDYFGFANTPVVREERMTQVELGVIAKKKTIEYEINYHQRSVRDIARQLILRCVPTFILD